MKSSTILIRNNGDGFDDAQRETQRLANEVLNGKQARQLGLITEEMLSLVRSVTGTLNAEFWLENEGLAFTLHLLNRQTLGNTQRNELIASSSSGQNEAAKGFLGKLREIYETALSVGADVDRFYNEGGSDSSMADLSDTVMAQPKWDKLERSVLLSLVDDVKIGIRHHLVELTVTKDFGA
ncbi:MAG: hypothetical protein IKS31_03470 [Clostridia bacterium]|nr:hypothetical protein [Clostridia bacterium]MBR4457998.1 hypothetical protein [Clostridia bacterium]